MLFLGNAHNSLAVLHMLLFNAFPSCLSYRAGIDVHDALQHFFVFSLPQLTELDQATRECLVPGHPAELHGSVGF